MHPRVTSALICPTLRELSNSALGEPVAPTDAGRIPAPLKVSMTCNGSSQGSTNTAACSLRSIVVTAQRLP